jgi:hypothetical protein
MARILMSYIFVCVIGYASDAYSYSGGSGSPYDPFLISTPQDWQMLCNSPNDINASNSFVLTNDLDLSGLTVTEVGTGSPSFNGSFDGRGHTISGLVFASSTNFYCGLFGDIGPAGYVHNLNLFFPSLTSVSGSSFYMGGLAGYNEGTISRCTVTGGTYNAGYPYMVGGFVGGNNGLIIDCAFTGDITIGNSSAWYCGGFTGYNWGTIAYCTISGSAAITCPRGGLLVGESSGRIYNCSASGSVSVTYYGCPTNTCGGLVGDNAGTIDSSWANVAVNGYGSYNVGTYVGGLVGTNWLGSPIVNSYAIGNVTGHISFGTSVCTAGGLVGQSSLDIKHCYSTGHISAVGTGFPLNPSQRVLNGLIGVLWSPGTINDSFWDVNTSGRSTSAAGVGLTTAQMKTYSSFASAGWDFTNETANDINDNWRMCTDGVDYPRLAWQSVSTGDFACPAGIDETDLAYLMNNWLTSSCPDSYPCEMADLDHSGLVDFRDFALFAQNWTDSL